MGSSGRQISCQFNETFQGPSAHPMAMMDDLITYHQPSKESKEPCAIAAAEGCLAAKEKKSPVTRVTTINQSWFRGDITVLYGYIILIIYIWGLWYLVFMVLISLYMREREIQTYRYMMFGIVWLWNASYISYESSRLKVAELLYAPKWDGSIEPQLHA